jgi:hypothetical protein
MSIKSGLSLPRPKSHGVGRYDMNVLPKAVKASECGSHAGPGVHGGPEARQADIGSKLLVAVAMHA